MMCFNNDFKWLYKIVELTIERLLNETPIRDIKARMEDIVDKLNDISADDLKQFVK